MVSITCDGCGQVWTSKHIKAAQTVVKNHTCTYALAAKA